MIKLQIIEINTTPFSEPINKTEIEIALNWQINWYIMELDGNELDIQLIRNLAANIAFLNDK